jgi:hypothetical protein
LRRPGTTVGAALLSGLLSTEIATVFAFVFALDGVRDLSEMAPAVTYGK